jgi:hypothetical protein
MTFLEFFYYDTGEMIFKLDLRNLKFVSYFNDSDEDLIKEFLNTDFKIDLNIFKKRRIRQIKIKKII